MYPRTGEGWLYLATVIDLATRMVTGWQLASHMRISLVTGALAMAITHGHVAPGAVFRRSLTGPAPGSLSPATSRSSTTRVRLHSTLGYRTPAEALTEFQAAATAA